MASNSIIKTTTTEYWLPEELWTMVKDYAGLIEKERGDKPPIQFKLFKHIKTVEPLRRIHRITAEGTTPLRQRPRITLDKEGQMRFGEKQTTAEEYKLNYQKWAMMGGGKKSLGEWWWGLTMNANKWRRLEKIMKDKLGAFEIMEEGSLFKIKKNLRSVEFEATLQGYLNREFEGRSFKEFHFIVITKTLTQIKFMVDSYHTGDNNREFFIFNGSKKERKAHLITATKRDFKWFIDVEFLRI